MMQPFDGMNFLTGEELSRTELSVLLDQAEQLRQRRGQKTISPLKGKTIALIFEKPSLRTRISFTVGVQELGGQVLELLGNQKKSEEPEDTVRVLQGMVHGLMLRTFEHSILERMTKVAKIPIINGLSDDHHPCQALADLLTLRQRFGSLKGLKLAYVGDGNNVLHSLLLLAPFVGVDVHYSCPDGYLPNPEILKRANHRANEAGAQIQFFKKPSDAVKNCQAVYTDVWTSMGFEKENQRRIKALKPFKLDLQLFKQAKPDAIAMHCLPMIRDQEISSEVADHPRSAVFQQSENRLHVQKALMMGLLSAQQKVSNKRFEYSYVI